MSFRDVLDVFQAMYDGTVIVLALVGFYAALAWLVGEVDKSKDKV